MKCQACSVRAATVHYSEMVDDVLAQEIHLCEECHALQKPGSTDILSMISGAMAPTAKASAEAAPAPPCPLCGLTYAAFRTRGRLGCPQCYDTFRAQLEPLLEKIHGSTQHAGKSPFDSGSPLRSQERVVLSLRRKLQEAVKAENYEAAAAIRDQLRRAEQGETLPDGTAEGASG